MEISIDDLHIASIRGGISYNEDFLFQNQLKEHANTISQKLLAKEIYTDLELSIENETIVIKRDESPYVTLNIDSNSISFSFGMVRIQEAKSGTQALSKYFDLVSAMEDDIKKNFRREFIGLSPIYILPYKEEDKNIDDLTNALNPKIFGGTVYTKPSNKYSFKIDFFSQIDDSMSFNLELRNKSNDIMISTDFRYIKPDNVSISEFMQRVMTEDYFRWLGNFFQNLTRNFEFVDLNYLKIGEKSENG